VARHFRIDEANALLPEVAERMQRLGELQAEAAAGAARARRRARLNGHGGGIDREIAEGIEEGLLWFERRGIQIKGISPPLVDFPTSSAIGEVLLCWTEGEEEIGFFHTQEDGFGGRRPLDELP